MEPTQCLVRPNMTHPEGVCQCFFGGQAPVFVQEENKEPLHAPRTPAQKSNGPKTSKRKDPKFRIRIR